jgi:hypothetical protein
MKAFVSHAKSAFLRSTDTERLRDVISDGPDSTDDSIEDWAQKCAAGNDDCNGDLDDAQDVYESSVRYISKTNSFDGNGAYDTSGDGPVIAY